MGDSRFTSLVFLSIIHFLASNASLAAPRLISQRYPNCVACHINPMGAGILTDYGSVVDEAQSLRGELFDPETRPELLRWKSPEITAFQDVRTTLTSRKDDALYSFVRYANSLTTHGMHFYSETFYRVASDDDEELWIDKLFVGGILHEAKGSSTRIYVGEDYLPSGLGNGISAPVVRIPGEKVLTNQSNAQLKLYDWSATHLFSAFMYRPSISQNTTADTTGGGAFYEHYLRPDFAVGGKFNFFKTPYVDGNPDFGSLSLHTRFGLGKEWAFLVDGTHSQDFGGYDRRLLQYSGTLQVFYLITEWLVPSVGLQFFHDRSGASRDSTTVYPELYARISRNFNITLTERYELEGANHNALFVGLAAKL